MTRKLLFILAINTILFSCEIDKSRYSIISTSISQEEEFSESKVSKMSDREIILLERLIKDCMSNYNSELKKNSSLNDSEHVYYLLEEFDSYYRQYVPFDNEFGEKIIWVNAFCSVPDNWDWRTQILGTDDGGNCYFNLKINLTNKTCSDIKVNGYA